MKLFLVCFLTLFISCCSSTGESLLDVKASYLKDVCINEKTAPIEGFGVLPPQDEYFIDFKFKTDPEILRLSNCHRDVVLYNVNKKYTFHYKPNPMIETGSCLLQITALDSKGRHQFGALSFQTKDESLEAVLYCNGSYVRSLGASVCQAKEGTTQVVRFLDDVMYKEADGCKLVRIDSKSFEITTHKDYCLYMFKDEKGRIHKLTTYGYTDIIKNK